MQIKKYTGCSKKVRTTLKKYLKKQAYSKTSYNNGFFVVTSLLVNFSVFLVSYFWTEMT